MGEFVKVGRVDDFPPGRGRAVRVDGRLVAVFRLGGRWYAVQDACPHMGASLADGRLEGCRVVCGWHGWEFDLATGRGRRPGRGVAVYEVRVEEDDVLVRPPEPARDPGRPEEEEWIRWDPDRFFKKKA